MAQGSFRVPSFGTRLIPRP